MDHIVLNCTRGMKLSTATSRSRRYSTMNAPKRPLRTRVRSSWLRRSSIQHEGQKVHVRLLHAACPLATHNHSRAVIAKRSYIIHSSFKATITGKEIPYNLDNNCAYQHPQNTPNEALGMTNDEPQLSSEEVQVYPAICNNNVSVLLLHLAPGMWTVS
ncbi:hypothetical protein M422DRAFT_35396 [Sphaerobolus stellatus SS14]|uniref:Uncharacterized protein n=1 Tax=Sphaerobolus stellatus (strain SS14) TaxID=990650 RepID=A0A0C9UG65_SPHS4|nr:hypothetical protein M422DRAFT_35396 [Sphaerobolus stellatus SS14]